MSEPSAAHASVNDTAFGNDPTVPRYGQSFADDALQLAKDPPPLPSQLTVRARALPCSRAAGLMHARAAIRAGRGVACAPP